MKFGKSVFSFTSLTERLRLQSTWRRSNARQKNLEFSRLFSHESWGPKPSLLSGVKRITSNWCYSIPTDPSVDESILIHLHQMTVILLNIIPATLKEF